MQNRKKAPDGFYTAREAIATIGIPVSSFYHLVKAGTIKGTVLPGRKEAIYPKTEIDRYARALRAVIEKFSNETMSFSVALQEDIPEIHALVVANCGGVHHAVPQEVMAAWTRRNPQALHVLRKGSEIVGYVSMFPLPLDTIMKRMAGQYLNRTMPIDDIQPYVPGQSINLYIAEAVVNLQDNNRRRLGARLLSEMSKFIYGLAEQDIAITDLYAVGTSAFGIRISRSFGMQPMDLPEGTREDRIPFHLEIATSDSPLVAEYRRIYRAAQVVGG